MIWSNSQTGKSYPEGMGMKFMDPLRERAEHFGAFVAQVRRERGLKRVTDVFGRPEPQTE